MSPRIDTTAMILAAGLGTRLKELTQNKPKALVPLNGKPLLQHCIENLIANGFYHIVINVHHFEGSFGGVPTTYYDLFRVENGFIAEHWDVMETIAEKNTWQNSNGKFECNH